MSEQFMNRPEQPASAAGARMPYAVAIGNAWEIIMATHSDTANQPWASTAVDFVPDDELPLPLPIFVTRATLPAFLRPLSTQCESGQ